MSPKPETRPTSPSTARQTGDERAAAWSFPGKRQQERSGVLAMALFGALAIHGALSLVHTDVHARALPSDVPELETLIPIDLPEEPDAPEPVAPEPAPEEPAIRPTTPSTDSRLPLTEPVSDTPGAPDGLPSAEASPDELAAPLLTGASNDADWSLLSGHGSALGKGGLGFAARGNGARRRKTTIQARDLSRPAIPPSLAPLVQKNFPVAAKLARVDGKVTVSAVIQADGTPTHLRVESVSPRGRGFGETCSRTVHQGPAWKPKLNRDGRPVASKETYTCHFRLPKNLLSETAGPSEGSGANRVWTRPAGG